MATYKSKPALINAPADKVFDTLSNLEGLKQFLANVPASAIPDDKRDMFDAVQVTADTLSFPAGPVGNLTLRVVERLRPTLVKLEGESTPVPMSLSLQIAPLSESTCEAAVAMDIEIPMMLKPMIGGTLQKMVDQFGQVIGALKFD